MAAMDTSGDGPPGFGAEATSEELILELFDVLERCPADARDAARPQRENHVSNRARARATTGRRAPGELDAPQATDAALEAVLAVAPPPPKVEGEEDAADGAADDDAGDASVASSSRLSKTEGMDFVRPPSAYDRYRDAMRAAVSREHPDLEPLAINEKLRAQRAARAEHARRSWRYRVLQEENPGIANAARIIENGHQVGDALRGGEGAVRRGGAGRARRV